jgi:hypothetical protein
MESELLAIEPGRRIEQRLTATGAMAFEETAAFVLTPIPTGTRFSVQATWRYTTLIGRLMSPLIAIAARKKLSADLARLKQLVEAA